MLDVRGELTAVSGDASVTVRGEGPRLIVRIDGRLPAGRGFLREASRRLGESGLDAHIIDRDGRRLATVGASVRSPLGRFLTGSPAVRPTARGVVAAIRTHTTKGTSNA